ncbi:MAG: hypothetical protein ACM3JI_03360 [Anaerolineae bacterium]
MSLPLEEKKRVFFGASVEVFWPEKLPKGRLIPEDSRHMTIAFLGQVPWKKLEEELAAIPKLPFHIGPVGFFDKLLFLPEKTPRVVAWHITWLEGHEQMRNLQAALMQWLKHQGYRIDEGPFLSHLSLARAPFDCEEWEESFHQLPLFIKGLHLYESVGHLNYKPLWSHPLIPPFKEVDHVADIAFHIYAENFQQLYLHAQHALVFKYPELLSYISSKREIDSLDTIILNLNKLIAQADQEIGTPFKAVSFHGKIEQESNQTLHWEMIVDV